MNSNMDEIPRAVHENASPGDNFIIRLAGESGRKALIQREVI